MEEVYLRQDVTAPNTGMNTREIQTRSNSCTPRADSQEALQQNIAHHLSSAVVAQILTNIWRRSLVVLVASNIATWPASAAVT
jgi:hypothetical protein